MDETAPTIRKAVVKGASLTVVYSEGLDETSAPGPDAFAVTWAAMRRRLRRAMR